MSRLRLRLFFFAVFAIAAFCCGALSASDSRVDLVYTNGLDEEIVEIRVLYSTPYDEPRLSRSRVNIPAGGQYRIGVQGTTLPETISIELAEKRYDFMDLSGLEPANYMMLEVVHRDGAPRLVRRDVDGEVGGVEQEYLTAANRSNAVDKDHVVRALEDGFAAVLDAVRSRIGEVREEKGELTEFSAEVGPIWNQENAAERCPEVAREWSEKNDREASWTGHWRTTVPGTMSVCDCVAGSAGEEETILFSNDNDRKAAIFPVFWMKWLGVAHVAEGSEPNETSALMRLRVKSEKAGEMFEELLSDLRVDGYRSFRFELESARIKDGDAEDKEEETINFLEKEMDKYDSHDHIVGALTAAYAKDVLRGSLAYVEDSVFDKLKAGEEVEKSKVVICTFSKGVFDVVFINDGLWIVN